MNVVSIDPAQVQQIIKLLTEIRDRLPEPLAKPKVRIWGWVADGGEGPPSADFVKTVRCFAAENPDNSDAQTAAGILSGFE